MVSHASTFQPFFQFAAGFHEHREPITFAQHLLSGLRRLIPSDYNSWKEVTLSGAPKVAAVFSPQHPQASALMPACQRHIHDHPVCKYWLGSGSHHVAVRWSDVAEQPTIEGTRLYHEFYRPLGVRHQMMVALEVTPSHLTYVALNRTRTPFSEEERACLTLLQPHASHALRHIRELHRMQSTIASFSTFVDTLHQGVLCLSPTFKIRWASKQGSHYLRMYFGWNPHTTRLPEALQQWLIQSQQRLGRIPRTFSIQSKAGKLLARVLNEQKMLYLFLEGIEQPSALAALKTLGLTDREVEVLKCIAQGKSNEDAALILGMGPQTVKKHLEHIYRALGVSNRTEAALKAREVLGRPASL